MRLLNKRRKKGSTGVTDPEELRRTLRENQYDKDIHTINPIGEENDEIIERRKGQIQEAIRQREGD